MISPKDVKELLRKLVAESVTTRLAAIEALGASGTRSHAAIACLRQVVEAGDLQLKRPAVLALLALGEPGIDALKNSLREGPAASGAVICGVISTEVPVGHGLEKAVLAFAARADGEEPGGDVGSALSELASADADAGKAIVHAALSDQPDRMRPVLEALAERYRSHPDWGRREAPRLRARLAALAAAKSKDIAEVATRVQALLDDA